MNIQNWVLSILLTSLSLQFQKSPVVEPRSTIIEYSFMKGSQIIVNGTTNIRDFNCVSGELFTGLNARFVRDTTQTLYFSNTAVKLTVAALDCGGKVINNDLSRILNAQQYPYIIISLKDVQLPEGKLSSASDKPNILAHVYITLSGRTRENSLELTGTQSAGDVFNFQGESKIRLSDYGIKPPTALFGMIKVRNEINVIFKLKLKTKVIS